METQETMMETDLPEDDGGSTWSLSVPTSTSNLNFHLTFDRDLAVFMPGQTVSGVIYFQLLVPESFKGLTVECIGMSKVHWTETETVGRDTETTVFSASETYYNQKTLILAGGEVEIEPGEYRYPFMFTLPYQLPSSFEGIHGSLRYYVRASLNRRYMLDAVFKKGFTVNNVVDLNLIYQAPIPAKNEESKTLCCWCCQSGPITAYIWIPKTGYVSGEPLIFCAQVENHSRAKLLSTSVQLVEKTIFKAQGRQKQCDRIITEISRILPQSSSARQVQTMTESLELWDHVPMMIPPLSPSGLHHCNIIDLFYMLEFIVNPGSMAFNFKVPLDIIVGTVPLKENFPTFQPSSAPAIQELDYGGASVPQFTLAHYPDLPLPTYENGLFTADLREEGDTEHLNIGYDTIFTPNYITYTSCLNSQQTEEKDETAA